MAQDSDRARMSLRVLPSVGGQVNIDGPPLIIKVHDNTETDQQFGVQQWDVNCNSRRGATVDFQTLIAFRNGILFPRSRRDARLDISLARSDARARWRITTATDETDYVNGDERATVSARSRRAGDATFNLNVTFITDDFSTLQAGNYITFVVGTITAN